MKVVGIGMRGVVGIGRRGAVVSLLEAFDELLGFFFFAVVEFNLDVSHPRQIFAGEKLVFSALAIYLKVVNEPIGTGR